jgi:hypothetical protein
MFPMLIMTHGDIGTDIWRNKILQPYFNISEQVQEPQLAVMLMIQGFVEQ